MYISTGWGPQIAKLPYKWLNSMVYGRYNELVNGVHKPTNITWGHHPVCILRYPIRTLLLWWVVAKSCATKRMVAKPLK